MEFLPWNMVKRQKNTLNNGETWAFDLYKYKDIANEQGKNRDRFDDLYVELHTHPIFIGLDIRMIYPLYLWPYIHH
jgi:hypothetical protein